MTFNLYYLNWIYLKQKSKSRMILGFYIYNKINTLNN
jgi:hypothetical protein